jgi:hypothetical protein
VRDACARSEEPGYYRHATEAEAALLLDDAAAARLSLARAKAQDGGDHAAVATTRKQLRRICAAKGLDPDVISPLSNPGVIHYTGHMADAEGAEEQVLAGRIGAALDEAGAGYGFGSLACGADILFAEALLARRARLHVVLPFNIEEFKQTSVARGGPGWTRRFDECLARAASVTFATEDSYLGDDLLFEYAGQLAMGLALLRAGFLDAPARQVAVWDGAPPSGPGGTASDVLAWRARGLPATVIELPRRKGAPAGPGEPTRSKRTIRAMLFADVRGFSKLREAQSLTFVRAVMGAFAQVLDRHGP